MRHRIMRFQLLAIVLLCGLHIITSASYAVPPSAPVNLRLFSTTALPEGQTTYIANLTPMTGTASSGSGNGVLSLNVKNGQVTVQVTLRFQGLTSKPTVGEVVDATGSVLFDLTVPTSGQTWKFAVSEPVLSRFVAALKSRLSIIVKTEQYPAGEIQGSFSLIVGSVVPPPTPTPPPTVDLAHVTETEASRFLRQATFGPTYQDIQHVVQVGISGFLDEELNRQYEDSPCLSYLLQKRAEGINYISSGSILECSDVLTTARDDRLLIQRMSFALSQLFVINRRIGMLENQIYEVAAYYDAFNRHALGNFRDLMEDVSRQVAMGAMLNIIGSTKNSPNENYARELLQLFTIGLWKLHPDGSIALNASGLPQPTYEQQDIVELAKVFTGYSWRWWEPDYKIGVMVENPELHSTESKNFMGFTIPAGLTMQQDLKKALDFIFNHPNVGPFISRFLIQRLVTSNPSPSYVYRVAQVFNNNGKGIRGDLGAVARAIFTDYEARNSDLANRSYYGSFSEPYKYIYDIFRAFKFRMPDGRQEVGISYLQDLWLGQSMMGAQTVFNFFRPDFAARGPIQEAGLVSPEFQNYDAFSISNHYYAWSVLNNSTWTHATSNLNEWSSLYDSGGIESLIERINLVFFAGRMPEAVKENVRQFNLKNDVWYYQGETSKRVIYLVMLALSAPEYRVQK